MKCRIRKIIHNISFHVINFINDNRFIECMSSFHEEAKTELNKIQALFSEMEQLYKELETYFAFDQKNYPLHSFMKDIKTFKDQFKVRNDIFCVLLPPINTRVQTNYQVRQRHAFF